MSRLLVDSGIEWIGKVPNNWKKEKLKNIYNFEKGKNASLYTKEYIADHIGEYPVFSGQTENDGIMGKIDSFDYNIPECLFTTTVGANVMTVKILSNKFSLSQNCLIMQPKNKVNNHFYYYLLCSLFNYEKSLVPSYMQPSLRIEDLKRYSFYVPSLEEQIKIANYLDDKCAIIDRTIADNSKVIDFLEEYKLNVVNDELSRIKNCKSGRLKLYMYEINERNDNPNAELLSVFTKIGVDKRENMEDRGNKAVTVMNYKIVKKNDMIVNKLLAWMGAFGVSNYDGVTSPDYDVYRFRSNSNPMFYHYYFRYSRFKEDCFKAGHGIMLMRWRTYPSELLNIEVPHPSLEKQNQIVEVLNNKFSNIEKVIEYRKKIIKKLEEYKKSLIYEVVTGKKEV